MPWRTSSGSASAWPRRRRRCCATKRTSATRWWGRSRTSCAPVGATRSSRSGCWASGCTPCWCATRRRSTPCATGMIRCAPGRWCCSPACPAHAWPRTGTRCRNGSGWTARRRRGCRRCSPGTRCWTGAEGRGRRCGGRTAPYSWTAVPRPGAERGGPCSGARSWKRSSKTCARRRRRAVERVRLDERLGAERARLAEIEAQQEAAREQRVQWQVDAAQVEARLAAARERAGRAAADAEEARHQGASLAGEIAAIDHDTATLTEQQTQWQDALKERTLALGALEAAATDAGTQVQGAEAGLTQAEGTLTDVRRALDALGAEEHKLELERTEILGRKRGLAERVEAEWRKPLDQLLADAPVVAGDLAWLRQENERLQDAIDAVGPVNALAVEEHAEEMKRLEFLMTQRDDLVAARQSLQQAAREIDRTAKAMFLESFGKVRENFRAVFQTLFGGGECDVRLANEDEPLESEIEIHAAPRGKRTQRIHLLSSGERTLVAVSLLFAIFLAKPSPFCLLDEVDAPLDDANVGRYVRLLAEFKNQTQFIVITHNPRTMQAADAVYGVTMQEPGVSTIVGVRLGQMEPV